MRSAGKVLLVLFLCGVVALGSTTAVLAATVAQGGLITVKVAEGGEDGVSVYLPVPAALVELAAFALPLCAPADDLAQLRREMRPWAPSLRAAAQALEEADDAVLVRVVSDQERVTVAKRGGRLLVEVDAPDSEIRVALPARTLSRVLEAVL